jgi:hypothetical protein
MDMLRTARANPSIMLVIAQFVGVLAFPFLESFVAGRALFGIVQMAIVFLALWSVRRTPALAWVSLVLGVPSMVLAVAEAVFTDSTAVILASAAFHVPFYFYVSYAMIRYLFHDELVTRDELYATVAAFTVVAWGFAYLFWGIQALEPDAFSGTGDGARSWFELLYLSFTVLTTLGLSDVAPVSDQARSVVMVEQVVGVMYVAHVVARLVALLARRRG